MYEIKYRKRDDMKNSGVEWLGMIPRGWGVKKLEHVGKEPLEHGANESAEQDDINLPRFIRITDFGDDGKLNDDTFKSLNHKKTKGFMLRNGDIFFARSGAAVGKTFQFKNYSELACFAGYLLKAVPDISMTSSDFVYYFTKTKNDENWKNGIFMQAAIQNIGVNKFKELKFCVPNYEDQLKIANFLDIETAQFDTIISKKELLIEKVEEAKKSLISEVVTGKVKIIDGDMVKREPEEMKDSGVEWLGMIPQDWILGGFTKYLESIIDYRGKTPEKVEDGIPLVTAKNIKNGRIDYDLSSEFVRKDKYKEIMSRGIPQRGEVLFTMKAPLGEVANVDKTNIALAQRVVKFNGQSGILNNYFLKYFILSDGFQQNLKTFATGSAAAGIKASRFTQLKTLVPPYDEQLRLAEYLDIYMKNIDQSIEKQINQIQKLKQAKQSLISEAVTGKIDLRDWEFIEEGGTMISSVTPDTLKERSIVKEVLVSPRYHQLKLNRSPMTKCKYTNGIDDSTAKRSIFSFVGETSVSPELRKPILSCLTRKLKHPLQL